MTHDTGHLPRLRTNVWRGATVVIALTLLVGCGDKTQKDSVDQIATWCLEVNHLATVINDGLAAGVGTNDAATQEYKAKAHVLGESLKADAPPSIKTEVATVIDTSIGKSTQAQQQSSDADKATVNAYVAQNCNTSFQF